MVINKKDKNHEIDILKCLMQVIVAQELIKMKKHKRYYEQSLIQQFHFLMNEKKN